MALGAEERKCGVTTSWPAPERGGGVAGGQRTAKRPYTAAEIDVMLRQAAEHGDGWLLPLRLLAETGARIGEVCGLREGDVVRDERGRLFAQLSGAKTHRPRRVPVSPELAARLPRRAMEAPLFVNERGRPLTPDTLRKRVRQLLDTAELSIRTEAEVGGPQRRQRTRLLDVHSFRRSFITHCSRAGVPKSVCMAIVGHELRGVHDSYERNATGDDFHEMVARMCDRRRKAARSASERPA